MDGLPGEVPILTEFSMVLLECRRRGSDFDSAWRAAMKVVRIERGNMDDLTREEMQDWRKALVWAREHFEASYARTHAQAAHPSLSDALSQRVSAGDDSRVAA